MAFAYRYKVRYSRDTLIFATLVVFALGLVIGLSVGANYFVVREVVTITPPIEEAQQAVMALPAVDINQTGVSATATVTVRPGNGKVLVNINNLLATEDVEHSARMAALVASETTDENLSAVDIIYDIDANASLLEGPSGGAALTITTIAALQNTTINKSVMITGSVNHDGTIGPSGKIYAKAQAARAAGVILFLVPIGASHELKYEEDRWCKMWGYREYCDVEYVPTEVDISEDVGIEIKEVRTIEEAMDYFLIES